MFIEKDARVLRRSLILMLRGLIVLYSHIDINNNNNNTNTGGTNEFISFYLQSLVTREERHNS